MFGELMFLEPKELRSPYPKSSVKMRMMFGCFGSLACNEVNESVVVTAKQTAVIRFLMFMLLYLLQRLQGNSSSVFDIYN